MRALTILLICFSSRVLAQQQVAQFVVWKPKAGREQAFEKGYRQHLEWHKNNHDPWGWYGWFIISGPRCGQFVDATVDHAWSDFDQPLKPADDRADNELHVYPYAGLQTVMKTVCLEELSIADKNSLQSKLLRMLTLQVSDINNGVKVIEQLKRSWPSARPLKNFMVYKIVDGGHIDQLVLLLGAASYEEYGKTENLQEMLNAAETALQLKVIGQVYSETLVYRADMSLLP